MVLITSPFSRLDITVSECIAPFTFRLPKRDTKILFLTYSLASLLKPSQGIGISKPNRSTFFKARSPKDNPLSSL